MKTSMYIILLALVLFSLNSMSQDLIFYNNAKDTIKCKIIKDKIEFIEYRIVNDTNVYRIYQEQYDYYIQNNETVNKQEYIIPDNKKTKRKNKDKKNK